MALKRGIVELEDYNSKWEKDYLKEEKLLKEVLKEYIIEIHHIGSTSIKGLKAKPVIDILIVIKSLNQIEKIEDILKEYDYTNRGKQGVDDRFFFAKIKKSLYPLCIFDAADCRSANLKARVVGLDRSEGLFKKFKIFLHICLIPKARKIRLIPDFYRPRSHFFTVSVLKVFQKSNYHICPLFIILRGSCVALPVKDGLGAACKRFRHKAKL